MMKKILLTKSNKILFVQKTPTSSNSIDNNNKNVFLKPYQELFAALFKIPDREVQARVIAAINATEEKLQLPIEMVTCEKCKQPISKSTTVDVGTQTIFCETTATITNSNDPLSLVINVDEKSSTPLNNAPNSKDGTTTEMTNDVTPKVKRKRRRKMQLPQVLKKSQVQQQQQPILKKRKTQMTKTANNNKSDPFLSSTKRRRSDSISSTTTNLSNILSDDCMDEIMNNIPTEPIDIPHTLLDIMGKELIKSEVIQDDGLIPIHSAITNKHYLPFMRQIYIWKKYKKIDLNELLTDNDQDCLQLAIEWNSSFEIIEELVQSGLNINSLDEQSNNLIHLSIHNEIDVNVFKLLMKRIDLKMILQLNDDGYTPLHLAVRQDNFILTEAILNVLDERLFGGDTYSKKINIITKENFLAFYERCCEQLAQDSPLVKYKKEQRNFKQKLINAGEMRSGNTALFFAIENKMEHMIYLLLAHLADPRILNHSGQNARAYLGEFAKLLNLSLKIDRVMEQVVNLLEE